MNVTPIVSVVMPAYNREATLERAVASVLAQTFRDFELLLVDDGSTDRTSEMSAEFARQDTRVRPLSGRRAGVSAARNLALAAARGSIFTYLDSDDAWMPSHLETVVRALMGRRRGLCYTGLLMQSYDAEGRLLKESRLLNDWDARRIYRGNRIGMNGLAHTRDLYEIAGGFDESMTRFVDWDFILRMVPHCTPRNLGVVTGYYHHYADSGRVSRSAPYAPNRLQIALRHRLGARPRVRVYGGSPHDLLRFTTLGLEAEPFGKEEWLTGFQPTNDDVIAWHWSEWDEHPDHLEKVAGKLAWASGLSFYFLPAGAKVAKVLPPSVHRRFDFVVAVNQEDKARFARESAQHQGFDLNPIDPVLVSSGANESAESLEESLRRLAAFRRPMPGTRWHLRADAGTAERAGRLRDALRLLGQDAEVVTSQGAAEATTPAHVIDFTPRRLVAPRGQHLHLLWLDGLVDEEVLAAPHAVLTENADLGNRLRAKYPGLRVQAVPMSAAAQARTVLAYAGVLLEAQHTDGISNYLRPRICYFFGNANANSTRKRCHEVAETLRGHFEVRLVPFSACSIDQMVGADVVVFQRWIQHEPSRVGTAFEGMTRLRTSEKIFAYDIDDYVFHLADGLPRTFMKSVDAVLVSTRKLQELVKPFNTRIELVPNGVDVDALDDIPPEPLSSEHLHVIAWSSDVVGLDRMRGLVEPIAARVPNVRFHFIGGGDDSSNDARVQRYSMLPITRLFALIRGSDVVLALADESPQLRKLEFERHGVALQDFFDAKSEIKFQYAGLAGTPIVAEPRPIIFAEVIEDGVTGRIVGSDREAVDAVCELLQDRELRRRLAENARARVLAEHTLSARAPRYREVFWRLARSPASTGLDPRDPLALGEALRDPDRHEALARYIVGATAAVEHLGSAVRALDRRGPDRWQMLVAGVRQDVSQAVRSPRAGLRLPKRLWRRLRSVL